MMAAGNAAVCPGRVFVACHDKIVTPTPMTKGMVIPARSLSTLISYLIFAKVAINFLTLQRLTRKIVNLIYHDYSCTQLWKFIP